MPAAGYDAVCERMGLVNGGPGPVGSIFSFTVIDDRGTRIYNVWETEEAAQAELDLTLKLGGEVAAAMGVTLPEPICSVQEIYAFYTANPA